MSKGKITLSEQDRADLARFRAAMEKLNAKQKVEVARWMLDCDKSGPKSRGESA